MNSTNTNIEPKPLTFYSSDDVDRLLAKIEQSFESKINALQDRLGMSVSDNIHLDIDNYLLRNIISTRKTNDFSLTDCVTLFTSFGIKTTYNKVRALKVKGELPFDRDKYISQENVMRYLKAHHNELLVGIIKKGNSVNYPLKD